MSSVMQTWVEWQLRVLVFGSFFLQFFLFIVAELRKFAIPSWFRLCIWLAYLGSDALAVYALATLFNRHRNNDGCAAAQGGGLSGILEVMWAPILLIHLGGIDYVSAYNMEDNELWTRHVATMLSQVTVAVYVFWKAWPPVADAKLLAASVLLFVVGVLKFSEKPRALKHASFNSVASSPFVVIKKILVKENNLSLKDYIPQAKQAVECIDLAPQDRKQWKDIGWLVGRPHEAFVDLTAPYFIRLKILETFLTLDVHRAYRVLQAGFCSTYDLLYTKEIELVSNFGCSMRPLVFLITLTALCLFAKSHKGGHDQNDVVLTYLLLGGAVVMEFFTCCRAISHYYNAGSLHVKIAVDRDHADLPLWLGKIVQYLRLLAGLQKWSTKVAQYNLMESFVTNREHTLMMGIARLFGCEDYVRRHYVQYCYSSERLTILFLEYAREGWKKHIHGPATYRKFMDSRGERTLQDQRCYEKLRRSIEEPFDKSVLLWHIATDLCFHSKDAPPSMKDKVDRCREMSNYMIYLLFIYPDMLMTGTNKDLFTTACGELERFPASEKELAMKILDKVRPSQDATAKGLIHDSCEIAEVLLTKLNEDERWEVIKGVWMEMLCYSAGKSKGYLHAKSLGTGGELLSYVWLLLSHMGMETFAERLQKPQFSKEEEGRDGPSTSEGRSTCHEISID